MRKGKVVEKFKRILISIMCVVTLVFAMPVKAKAGIFDEFVDLILRIPDGIMWIGNRYLADRNTNDSIIAIGLEGVHGWKDDDGHIYNFFVTPYDIFTAGEVRTYKDTKGNERTYRNLPIFYANFFNTGDGIIAENDENALKSNEILRPALGNIYIYLRNLCLVLMMLVLLYIGIKIIISSVSTEQAKYKQMLIDWLVGVSLLFLMHYIMSFIMNINDIVVDMLKNNESATYYISFPALGDSAVASNGIGEEWYEFFDDYNEKAFIDLHLDIPGNVSNGKTWEGIESGAPDAFDFIEKNDVESGKAKPEDLYTIQVDTHTDWGDNGKVKINAVLNANDGANSHRCVYRANLMEYIRTLSSYSQEFVKLYTNNNDGVRIANNEDDEQNLMARMGYGILYLTLVVETIMFVVVYIKRLLQLAMLTMISPLVAFMYPIDKIGDGKAQAFNYWFKEYMFYALLQPMHMLLYTVFVSSALSVAANNLLYAIVALAFIVPAEKIVKQMFGIKGNTESTLGGFAGGALASQAFNMLRKGPPQPKKGGGDGPKGEKGIRLNNPNKPNAMDTLAGDAMENGVENAAQTATAAGIGAAAGAASANATGNENNEETDSNGVHVSDDGVIDGVQFREVPDNEQQGNGLENPEMQSGENPAMPENGQQNQNADNNNSEENPFAAIRAKANSAKGNLGSAINSRVQSAGGWSGIAKGVGKTGAKLAGRAAMMTTMGALGLGVGIVGGDMSDTLKGLGAGLTAGYATGGRLNSAVGNTIVGNNAAGRFLDDAIRGTGPERKRNDYIRSYMSNQENRNRLIEKNPSIKKSELDAQLRQRAELSYDSGVTDAKMLDRAIKLQKQLDEKNPRGVGNAERHGANYNKTVATMQLASKYSDSTFENDEKIAKAQNRLASKLERNMSERTNGPIDADTAKKYKARAKAEAAETMGNIDYLKNG